MGLLLTIIRLSLKNLWANKLRSILTMLGMIIGVSSVITMVAIGRGAERAMLTEFRRFGSPNSIQLFATYRGTSADRHTFTLDDCEAIMQEIPAIAGLSPGIESNVQVKRGNKTVRTQLSGASNAFFDMRNLEIDAGRVFLQSEEKRPRKVVVLGYKIVEDLFYGDPQAAVGQELKINGANYTIVGTLKERGASPGGNPDDLIVIPYTTAMKRITGRDDFWSVSMVAASEGEVEAVAEDLKALMRRRHKIQSWQEDDFRIFTATEALESIRNSIRIFTALISGIAAISLLVGGIGIMNIMLVTVTERTKEIGLRKALGARRRDIMRQFLVEALVISFSGGIIGISLGALAAYGINTGASKAFKLSQAGAPNVSLLSVLIAFGVCFVIGLFFGLYPARKASLLDPIEALRHE